MSKRIDPRTPVLVGVAQYVDRTSAPEAALSPLQMLEHVARGAHADSDIAANLWQELDHLTVIRTFADSAPLFRPPFWNYTNLPRSLAARLGASPRRLFYPQAGGNTPQDMVHLFCEAIAQGEADIGLIAGAEAIRTQSRAQKSGLALNWSDDPGGPAPEEIGETKFAVTPQELAHGIAMPANVYPLFENALGHHYGVSPLEHRANLGKLMAGFTQVAARNPYSALPQSRSASELIEPSHDNRYIAYPYTKYLNSNMFVDQAAALLILSTAAADRWDVPDHKRVYLHGSAQTTEKWFVCDRVNYSSSPALRVGVHQALAQAEKAIADIKLMDLYSCFPVAVEIAADALGIAHDDPRGLTITGGLPYFGGPGNNYVTHSIAEMVARLRAAPSEFGLITANGLYLTKHSFGVYSTTPPPEPWTRTSPATYQAQIDLMGSPPLDASPNGPGTLETFTVIFDRGEPRFAIVIGRLDKDGARFLAQVHNPAQVAAMVDATVIGRPITVTAGQPVNVAELA